MRSIILRTGLAAFIAGAAVLAGCSQPERLDTPETRSERLQLPPDLVSPNDDNAMRIPALSGKKAKQSDNDTSRPVLPGTAGVKVERSGSVRWLQVNAEPQQVLGWVADYVKGMGVKVSRKAPELGLVETGWLYRGAPVTHTIYAPEVKDADAAEVADRYVIQLERGDTSGTTNVLVANHRISRGPNGDWQRAAAEPYMEEEFLRGFMVYLGANEAESLQRMRATAGGGAAAELTTLDSGATALRLQGGEADAWRRVGQGLERAGFTVVSRDRQQRAYVVRYDPKASVRESDDESQVPRYRLQLQDSDGGVLVTVKALDEEGSTVQGTPVSERILALLREQLG